MNDMPQNEYLDENKEACLLFTANKKVKNNYISSKLINNNLYQARMR